MSAMCQKRTSCGSCSDPMQGRVARRSHPHHPRTSSLLARVSHSIPDLLCDLIQVPALGALKGRELFVALKLLEPQQLAEGQHVPVVYVGCNRPGERTGPAESRLPLFAYRGLEWIALEVCHASHELGLDSRDVEAKRSFWRDREIHLPVLVAHCRRLRTGIVEEGVARGTRLAFEIIALVDAIERGPHDTGILAGLDLLLQSVALGSAGDVDERRQPVKRREDVAVDRSRLDDAFPAHDRRRAHAALPSVH